jgi:hypothetical protein
MDELLALIARIEAQKPLMDVVILPRRTYDAMAEVISSLDPALLTAAIAAFAVLIHQGQGGPEDAEREHDCYQLLGKLRALQEIDKGEKWNGIYRRTKTT